MCGQDCGSRSCTAFAAFSLAATCEQTKALLQSAFADVVTPTRPEHCYRACIAMSGRWDGWWSAEWSGWFDWDSSEWSRWSDWSVRTAWDADAAPNADSEDESDGEGVPWPPREPTPSTTLMLPTPRRTPSTRVTDLRVICEGEPLICEGDEADPDGDEANPEHEGDDVEANPQCGEADPECVFTAFASEAEKNAFEKFKEEVARLEEFTWNTVRNRDIRPGDQVLNIVPGASREAKVSAARRLLLVLHPDKRSGYPMTGKLKADADAAFFMVNTIKQDLEGTAGVTPADSSAEQSTSSGSSSGPPAPPDRPPAPLGWSVYVCPTVPAPECYIQDASTGQFMCLLCMTSSKSKFTYWEHMTSKTHVQRSAPDQWRGWLLWNLGRFADELGLRRPAS